MSRSSGYFAPSERGGIGKSAGNAKALRSSIIVPLPDLPPVESELSSSAPSAPSEVRIVGSWLEAGPASASGQKPATTMAK